MRKMIFFNLHASKKVPLSTLSGNTATVIFNYRKFSRDPTALKDTRTSPEFRIKLSSSCKTGVTYCRPYDDSELLGWTGQNVTDYSNRYCSFVKLCKAQRIKIRMSGGYVFILC